MRFFGRSDILAQLESLWGKQTSSFVTCRGRRRIGKSTLIERFAYSSDARFVRIEGFRPNESADNETELQSFASQLSVQIKKEVEKPIDWLHAFVALDEAITDDRKTVVLLDEVSWMAAYDKTFANTLKIAWDNYFKKHDRLVFVVCGSVSTWIKENIVDNGAFYGRRSLDVVVPELPLRDCVRFWGDTAERTRVVEILDVLSVTGGVPRYLEEIDPALSATENLRRLCFVPNALLRVDFDEMFRDVITKKTKLAGRIVRTLGNGARTVGEIAEELRVSVGGDISEALEQLVESRLVFADGGKNPKTGARIRQVRYRLADNYSRFYLRYIEPVKDTIDDGAFVFTGLDQFSGWATLMGLQFESLVVNHYAELLTFLHLDNVMVKSAAPYFKRGTKTNGGGCQVDLLLQTNATAYLVEIKRKDEIGREIIDEVNMKCERLPLPRDKSFRRALVYEGKLVRSVEADGYFDAVVPFRRLLGL